MGDQGPPIREDFQDGVFFNADCFDVFPLLADGSVDMVLVDLPYGITSIGWDIPIKFTEMWPALSRLTSATIPMIFTGSQPFTTLLINSNLDSFRYEWIWQKNYGSNFAQSRKRPFKEHENVCVFYDKQPTYNPIMEERSEAGKAFVKNCDYERRNSDHSSMKSGKANRDPNLRLPGSVKKFNMEVGIHPTQKPVALFEYLIKTYTNEGDLVLDFTAGSGTTAVAARNAGRRFICVEKDPEYFAKAIERLKSEGAS